MSLLETLKSFGLITCDGIVRFVTPPQNGSFIWLQNTVMCQINIGLYVPARKSAHKHGHLLVCMYAWGLWEEVGTSA